MDEGSSTEQKTWQVYSFGKRSVFRLHWNESREDLCRRGRGKSFHVDGPKTETAWLPLYQDRKLATVVWLGVGWEEAVQRLKEVSIYI